MKILQINVTSNWGSTGFIAEEIGQIIELNNGESYIACGRKIRKSSSEIVKIGTRKDVLFHVLQTRLFDRHGLASTVATHKLIEEIIHIAPDIIHLHNIHGYYINYKILFEYLAISDIPVVWTLHDCWLFTGHCSHFSSLNCERWKTGCFACPQKKNYPSSWLGDRSKKNYQDKKTAFTSVKNMVLVPVSEWLATEVAHSFLKNYPIKVIHNGIDIHIFSPIKEISDGYSIEGKFVILGVASIWSQRKGLNDFVKLSELLNEDEVIILVGLSEKQIKNLPSNVIGMKRTESLKHLVELYSRADVFVNPTWEDNFPTTNLEALACGTPVITYRTGGNIEAIDINTGAVVEQGNVTGLYKEIKYMKLKGKSYYTQSCRNRAISYFDKKDRYQEYIKLYKEILNIK